MATPADHFKPGDAPLIQGYAEAIVLAQQAAVALASEGPVVAGRTSPWLDRAGEGTSRRGEPQHAPAAISAAPCRQSFGRAQGG
jgi:hypothetical protein